MRKKFREIQKMNRFQLKLFVAKHKNRSGKLEPFRKVMTGKYSEYDRLLASELTYALNRLRIQ